jgi:CRISPR-associated protein Cmr2
MSVTHNLADRFRTKVSALTHDPLEKAFALGRSGGHEAGTVRHIRTELGLDPDVSYADRFADRLAAAADRLPGLRDERLEVHFASSPVIIHPLSPDRLQGGVSAGTGTVVLSPLPDVQLHYLEQIVAEELQTLVVRAQSTHNSAASIDWQQTHAAFWRFAVERVAARVNEGSQSLGQLWRLLPADTRFPDHAIVAHLDLASAYAGTLGRPALLSVNLGPVQTFIRASHSTADLWAGSHILSVLTFAAMLPIMETFGPDAVIMPNLRGNPLVDAWLARRLPLTLRNLLGERIDERARRAALPNRFIALVNAAELEDLEKAIRQSVDTHLMRWVRLALETRSIHRSDSRGLADEELASALAGFPELAIASVDITPTENRDQLFADLAQAASTLGITIDNPADEDDRIPLRSSDEASGSTAAIYPVSAGEAYAPAFAIAATVLDAIKAARRPPAAAEVQVRGARCTRCGERAAVATWRSAGNEELALCALCGLKHAWRWMLDAVLEDLGTFAPASDVDGPLDTPRGTGLPIVSTHTMARVPTVRAVLQRLKDGDEREKQRVREQLSKLPRATEEQRLPRLLARRLRLLADRDRDDLEPHLRGLLEQPPGHVLDEPSLPRQLASLKLPTTAYYALVKADGDQMGAWLAPRRGDPRLSRRIDRLHPTARDQLEAWLIRSVDAQEAERLRRWWDAPRRVSPAWHGALSEALATFSLRGAPWLLEEAADGYLVYAGGDDLLGFLPLDRVTSYLWLLPAVFQGVRPTELAVPDTHQGMPAFGFDDVDLGVISRARFGHGFLQLDPERDPIMLAMGPRATISTGVVIAHYSYPLRAALRELEAAEHAAKAARRELGPDGFARGGFAIHVLKRSGGTERIAGHLGEKDGTLAALVAIRQGLQASVLSRSSLTHLAQHVRELPPLENEDELVALANLVHLDAPAGVPHGQEERLAAVLSTIVDATRQAANPRQHLLAILAVGEFLTRGLLGANRGLRQTRRETIS